MKVVVALAATASALVAPVAKVAPATVVDAKSAAMPFLECPAALDGLDYPGNVGFDPLRFTDSDWNMAEVIIPAKSISATESLPMVYWMREAELKHGRLCMLAIVGYLTVDAGIHFPGARYEGLSSLQAHDAMVASGNMGFMLLAVGVLELLSMVGVVQAAKGSGRKAGDFSWDPLYFTQGAKADFFFEAEIQHARLAMLAFSGLVTQSALLEKGFPYF